MIRAGYDLLRAAVAAAALLAAPSVNSLLVPVPAAQATATSESQGGTMPSVDPNQITLMQWAAKEAPAYVVILVILFFYRRDWKTAVDFWRDQHTITTKMVQENTVAQTETAAALRENTTVVHQAKHVMAKYLPERRDA